jgi:hypothetical protein
VNPVRTSILAAVHSTLAQDPGILTAFPGGLWTGEIPEEQATRFPAAVLDQRGGTWEFTSSGTKDLERAQIAVSAFAETAASLESCLDRLQSFLPDASYTFLNGDNVEFLIPVERTVRSEIIRAPDGNEVFAGDLVFDTAVWRN